MDADGNQGWTHGAQIRRQLGRMQQYGAIFVRITLLLDSIALYVSLYVAVHQFDWPWGQRFLTLALLGIVAMGLLGSFGQTWRVWEPIPLRTALAHVALSLLATFGVIVSLLLAGTTWLHDPDYVLLLVLWFALAWLGMAAVRAALQAALRRYRIGASAHRRVAFVGDTATARRLSRLVQDNDWMGMDVVGTYDDNATAGMVAGTIDDLRVLAEAGGISAIYITLPMADEHRIKAIIDSLADTMVSIHYCLPMLDFKLLHGQVDDVFGQPVISVVASPFESYKRHLKRIEDLVLVAAVLPAVAIPMLAIALAVRLTSPGPILYRQPRYGLDGRSFKILKFRSMYSTDTDHEFVQARKNDSRITPLGTFLRRTSLDELPQLLNVLKGDMSVVGPRPAPVKYNEDHRRLIYRYMVRHKVKPGITGLAQVSGSRGETESIAKTEQRTELDLRYIDTWSLLLDMRILWQTAVLTFGEFRPR